MTLLRRALSLIVLIATLSVAAQARMPHAGATGHLALKVACHDSRDGDAPIAPRYGHDCAHCLACEIAAPPVVATVDPQVLRIAILTFAPPGPTAARIGAEIPDAHRARAPPVFA